jgi:hypothetical protein
LPPKLFNAKWREVYEPNVAQSCHHGFGQQPAGNTALSSGDHEITGSDNGDHETTGPDGEAVHIPAEALKDVDTVRCIWGLALGRPRLPYYERV